MKRSAFISRRSTDTHNVTGRGFMIGRVAITHETLLYTTSIIDAHLGDLLKNSLFQALCELTSVYEASRSCEGISRSRI